jgi:host factor-I protein
MPPPDSTGAEAAYLAKNKEARTPMVVNLMDGEVVRGWIEYYDRDMLKINRDGGPNLFIRKANIRYMYKDPEGEPATGATG